MSNVHYISKQGLEKLKSELEHRTGELRRQIADSIGTAKEQGDLSENFEYQDAKERQAQNETRIIELRDFIARCQIVEKSDSDSITIGSKFIAKTADGSEKTFELVGSTESDPLQGKISNDSPIGNAFFGKKAGETAEFKAPSGIISYTVISIE